MRHWQYGDLWPEERRAFVGGLMRAVCLGMARPL